jgi:glycosyltransferase involved in cell wall biosynthesis
VSVVVPTRNRAPYLRSLFAALATQIYPADRLELIVIDNDSSDDTEIVVSEAGKTLRFPVKYQRKADEGPAAARNLGATLASGEILAFTDSDCIPDPAWLPNAVARFRPNTGVVCGPIIPIGEDTDMPFFLHQIYYVDREDGLYATANVFYRRSVFLEIGGFNENFRTFAWGQPVGGDDTDMAWRVKRAGHASAFAKGAPVFHQATPVTPTAYMMQTAAAQVLPKLVKEIPELRDTCLWRRYFLHRRGATFYLFLAGTLLARSNPWSLALTLPWLWSNWPAIRNDVWPPKRWKRAAARLALEVPRSGLLAAALAYGTIRNRTVVL